MIIHEDVDSVLDRKYELKELIGQGSLYISRRNTHNNTYNNNIKIIF